MKKWGIKLEKHVPKYIRTRKGTDAEKQPQLVTASASGSMSICLALSVQRAFYKDAVLLDSEIWPYMPLPMNPDDVCLYIFYQFGARGIELEHPDPKVPVKDVLG
jgi:hypothetical protein